VTLHIQRAGVQAQAATGNISIQPCQLLSQMTLVGPYQPPRDMAVRVQLFLCSYLDSNRLSDNELPSTWADPATFPVLERL